MAVALITGASRGFGRALARSLALDGWSLVLDARGAPALDAVATELVRAHPNGSRRADRTRRRHRSRGTASALVAAAEELGGLDLLVNNASVLGPSPQPHARDVPDRRAARRVRRQRGRAARAHADRVAAAARVARHDREHHLRRRRARRTRVGAATDRRRPRSNRSATSSAPRNPTCACTRSIPATCARRCTRRRSRARTSPIAPNRRRSCRRFDGCLERARRVDVSRSSELGPMTVQDSRCGRRRRRPKRAASRATRCG